jgi:DNA invertase Pin-like site-specific DNA recombinase
MKKAAIYIRVSTKPQAERVSLQEQERECRAYAKKRGYAVSSIYKDVMSGTKKARPEITRLLKETDTFDILIAWNEDRLCRGVFDSGFIEIMRAYKRGEYQIEFVNGVFDQLTMTIKVAVAEQENERRVERTHVGVKARLRKGIPWNIQSKYGYAATETGEAKPNANEAAWVKQMFEWFTRDVGVREISRRLIAKGALMKIGSDSKRTTWAPATIYRILNDATYATGVHKSTRGGENFEAVVPKLVDIELYRAAQKRIEASKGYPANHTKYHYLLAGLVTSACGVQWRTMGRRRELQRKDGRGSYPVHQLTYRCTRDNLATGKAAHDPDCPRTKGVVRLDSRVWGLLSGYIRNPDALKAAAVERLTELKEQHKDARQIKAQLESKLKKLEDERGAYVELFGKSEQFTQDDLDLALERVAAEQQDASRQLAELETINTTDHYEIESLVDHYLLDIREATDWLDKEPESEQEAELQFQERRKIVKALVSKVVMTRDQLPRLELNIAIPVKAQNELQQY